MTTSRATPRSKSPAPKRRLTQHDYFDIVADMLRTHGEPELAKAVRKSKRIIPNCEVV